MASHFRVLVIGGYGNFGRRICESLAGLERLELLVAGRSEHKAQQACTDLLSQFPALRASAVCLDIDAIDFEPRLVELSADLVIHTSGPFQGQSYRVPKACIMAKSHYIDLADDRRFVCDISQLDELARAAGILMVSGASSVPGLSCAVIDHYREQFERIDTIDVAIAPGNRLERGYATVKAILTSTGQPFMAWIDSRWQPVYGWLDSIEQAFVAPVGPRLLANVEVPDVELFPLRYAPVRTVRFKAGLELGVMHRFMVFMAWLAKRGVVKNWAPYTGVSLGISRWFERLGTDLGAMRVALSGVGLEGEPKTCVWTLVAPAGVGPNIPTIAALLIAQKLHAGTMGARGATPCVGLLTLAEFTRFAKNWGIYEVEGV